MLCASLSVGLEQLWCYFLWINRNCALNLFRVTTDFCTPLIKNFDFVGIAFWRTKVVVLLSMLGNKAQRALLSTAANHDWNVAVHRLWVQFAHTILNHWQTSFKQLQTLYCGTEFISVFDVVAFEPTGPDAEVHATARHVVSRARHADDLLEELDRELDLLMATPADEIDTTLLIHPTLFDDFLDFNDFLDVVDAAIDELDLEGVIQVASFHPDYEFGDEEPGDITHYTNRSPYPTLHLLREASLEQAIDAIPDAADIFETNKETMRRLGDEGWQALWKE